MRKILILNEREFVEDVIQNPDIVLDYKIGKRRMCYMLAEYFGDNVDRISEVMDDIYFDFYKEQWINNIEKIIKDVNKNNLSLRERKYIPVYQSDIDKIHSIEIGRAHV